MALLTSRAVARFAQASIIAALCAGCPQANSPTNDRPAAAEKWFRRAVADFRTADVEDARDSAQKALAIVPADEEVRLLAGRIALARLDYSEALRLLKDLKGSEASGLRGRAYWYKGDLEPAADELEATLNDPDVKDPWAKEIAKLARQGAGRTPFTLSGSLLAAVEMPHVHPLAAFFVVPLEIDGEPALAMISTGNPEVVLDSSTRQESSWISLRFDERLEVHDVPAILHDLSAISKQVNAPIKALLGVNLLRHLNATLDYEGRQFVARTFSPPAPPDATRCELFYLKGGGMVLGSALGSEEKSARASLVVDTSSPFPIALDEAGWKKAGVDTAKLELVPDDPEQKLKTGTVPLLKLGQLPVARVPGVFGAPIADMEKAMSADLDGAIGAGLLSRYRVTFGDGGRVMWLEDHDTIDRMLFNAASQGPPPQPGGSPLMAPPQSLGLPPTNEMEHSLAPPPPATPEKADKPKTSPSPKKPKASPAEPKKPSP